MNTFFNILQTMSGIKHKIYPDIPFIIFENIQDNSYTIEQTHIKTLINSIFYKTKILKNKKILYKNAFAKFDSLKSILENDFYKTELKDKIFDIFQKSQKCYYAFIRLSHIYKLKKHPYTITEDLMMNQLDPNHKLTFILVEKKSNFLFNINEIINIIETAICNSPNFFCNPLSPLNPWNNQKLSFSTLYNIYFKMKQIGRVIPLFFHYFFLENFDIDKFVEQYEPNIREYSIKKYIFNSPYTSLYSSVIFMLKNNLYSRKLYISKYFPKDLLVDIFRPFLFLEFISNYYIEDTNKFYQSSQLLHIKLKNFYKFNPSFGRKTIKLIKKNNKIIKREYIINSKHISFYNIPLSYNNITIGLQNWNSINTQFTNYENECDNILENIDYETFTPIYSANESYDENDSIS